MNNRLIKKVRLRELRNQIKRIERAKRRKQQLAVQHIQQKLNRYKRNKNRQKIDMRKREFEKRRKPKKVLEKKQRKTRLSRRLERQLEYRRYEVAQQLMSNLVQEAHMKRGVTHISTLQHPPMYQQPIIEVDRKDLVRQVYLRDRQLHLDRNYHLH